MPGIARHATAKDSPAIMALLAELARLHGEHREDIFRAPTEPRTKHTAESLEAYGTGDGAVFVVEDEGTGEVAGILFCQVKRTKDHPVLQDSTVLWVEDVCVDRAYRGHGYGQLLMARAKEHGREKCCSRLDLNVWAFNKGAHDFYKAMGMREQRTIMELEL